MEVNFLYIYFIDADMKKHWNQTSELQSQGDKKILIGWKNTTQKVKSTRRYIITFNSEETTHPIMHCKDFSPSLS